MAVSLKIYQRETKELSMAKRDERGKGPVGRLRREAAMVPGVVYGHHQEPFAFKIAQRELERALAAGGQNAIFILHGGTGDERAVVREIQYHKVRGSIEHVDFLRINPNEEYTASVPLTTRGIPVGVRIGGGAVQHSLNAIDMTCVASAMPSQIEIDITDLQIGDSIHVRDLLEQESRIVSDPDVTIVSVLTPRLTIDEELEAEAAAEGEAAEAAAEGEGGDEGEAAGGGDDAES